MGFKWALNFCAEGEKNGEEFLLINVLNMALYCRSSSPTVNPDTTNRF